jgi:hypothetical protein
MQRMSFRLVIGARINGLATTWPILFADRFNQRAAQ